MDRMDVYSSVLNLFFGWFLSLIEKSNNLHFDHAPIFIIGAPRSGTTIIYQALTNRFKLSYVDNIIHCFYKFPLLGFKLSKKFYPDKAHNTYKSDLGRTYKYSMHAPSECGKFWSNWLYSNKLNEIIGSLENPFIAKNTTLSLRLNDIKKQWPNARIIYVKRDPKFTAQSILKARQKQFGDQNEWFSVKTENYESLKSKSPVEQVVHQIHEIELKINNDKKLFIDENWFEIQYEDFCKNSDKTLQEVQSFLGSKITVRDSFEPLKISFSEKQSIDDTTFEAIKKEIDSLNWQFEQ